MLPDSNYVEFNYLLLDLGGIICTSFDPKCFDCALNQDCFFFSNNQIQDGIDDH